MQNAESRKIIPAINWPGINFAGIHLFTRKGHEKPIAPAQPLPKPFEDHISGPISVFLSEALKQAAIPPEGTGVVTIPTEKGDIIVDYSHRVISAPPESYRSNPLEKTI